MIINSVKLKNFKSYEDEIEFSFTPSKNKNIILIGGENGSGKSTLFEAIRLCIYGPTSYGYLGYNSIYLDKIKNNINSNAFKNDVVDCSISVTLSFTEGTKCIEYTLNRKWLYIDRKLTETFEVYKNNIFLDEDETNYFKKYLQSNIPPSLFDFFFFDGEELSKFFKGKNTSLNESVLQLFNYDTFSILKKQLISLQRKITKHNHGKTNTETEYEESLQTLNSIQNKIKELELNISNKKNSISTLYMKKEILEKDFQTSGGILEKEEQSINSKILSLENERALINQRIKDYCNNTLPFLLVTDLLRETSKQISNENTISMYKNIKNKLSGDIIQKALTSHDIFNINESAYSEIAVTIINHMFNTDDITNSKEILMLSSEQQKNILFTFNTICNKESELKAKLLKDYDRLNEITEHLKILRDKLNSSVNGDFVNDYLQKLAKISNDINSTEHVITTLKYELSSCIEQEKTALYKYSRAKNAYTSFIQDGNNLNLSSNIIKYINELLNKLTKDKLMIIENNFLDIFNIIIRKNNYVSSIVINSNFEVTLYVTKHYSSSEIMNIIHNLNVKDITQKYGAKFIEDLVLKYDAKSFDDLLSYFKDQSFKNNIELKTKVNVNDFSKGEKQIYILCLIWSLMKSSKKEIPFILDTPYARIDETHRKSLTIDFLPNISKQVILLSTNEEIDNSLYKTIKPHVCHEYMLLYNEKERKTEVKKGYFEV